MSEGEPDLSVVIPTYNRAEYLPEAVESALAQRDVSLEVIIVDDGSTDETRDVVRRLLPEWGHRVRYVVQQNSERSVARNNGLGLARAPYVAFLDSDDIWRGNHARTALSLLVEEPGLVASYGEYGLISADGRVIRHRVDRPILTGDDFRRALVLKQVILHPTEVILRRSALPEPNVFDPDVPGAEDWLLWVLLSAQGDFRSVGKETVWMRVHPKGTFGDPEKFTKSLLLATEKAIESGVPRSFGIHGGRLRAINRVHSAYAHYLDGRRKASAALLLDAIKQSRRILVESDFWSVVLRLCIGTTLSRRIRRRRHRGQGEPLRNGSA